MTALRRLIHSLLIGAACLMLAAPATARTAHDFSLPGIDGAPLPLSAYAGKPILVVNTASFCGFTPQYEGLQELWSRYRDQGFILIGAPSQDFRQEHSDEAAVKRFCEINFGIDFPMTAIISVRGPDAHPLFQWFAEQSNAPRWNFNKYLIDGDGRLVKSYGSSARPAAIAKDVEALLSR